MAQDPVFVRENMPDDGGIASRFAALASEPATART
jgi:hypothetical protein